MKKYFLIPFVFLLLACSGSKQYYEPTKYSKLKEVKAKKEKLPKEFKNYEIINTKDNLLMISNDEGFLKIIEDKEVIFNKKFDTKIISVDILDDKAVAVDSLNNIIVFDLLEQKYLFSQNFGTYNGIIKNVANPIISDRITMVPTLDGKLIILDNNSFTPVKSINLGTQNSFNNIIFLKTHNDTLVTASASKIFTLHNNQVYQKTFGIKQIFIKDNHIYVFSSNGEIIKYDYELNEILKKKYKYAIFSKTYLYNDYIYALEYGGYVIKLDDDLNEIAVYKLGSKIKKDVLFEKDILFFNKKSYRLKWY